MTFQTFSLILLISLGYFATDVYLPSMPAISEQFSAENSTVQLTMFFYMFSFAMTPLLFGPMSDQIGRKKVILVGLYVLLFGTVGCFISPSISWLIFFRFVQGIGGGAIIISARAMIPDILKGVDIAKQVTQITMFMPLALALGPLIGGYLQEYFGWRSVFLFLFIYELAILFKMRFVDESLIIFSEQKFSHVMRNYKELLLYKRFVAVSMGLIFPSIGLFAYLAVSSFLFQDFLGLSPFGYGFLSIFIGASVMLSSYINKTLLSYCSLDSLLWAGVAVMVVSGSLLMFFHFLEWLTPVTVLIPVLLYFACLPLCISNSVSKAMTLIDRSYGAAGALITTVQFFAGSMGILVFTMGKQDSVVPLAVCFLLMSFLTGIAFRIDRALNNESSSE